MLYKPAQIKPIFRSFYLQDIHMTPERKMVDIINEPLMLCKFPAEISPFLMARCDDDRKLTESVSYVFRID